MKKNNSSKNTFLLHCCCAPCALPMIEYLKGLNINPDLYFSNSNIFPKKEFEKRKEEVKKIAGFYHLNLIIDNYQHSRWLKFLKENLNQPLENYPENGQRCQKCFEFRLKNTFDFALKNNYQRWGTTLSVNRFKDTDFINNFSLAISNNGPQYFVFSLSKNGFSKESLELTKKYQIYRQKYCGCEFSLNH